MGAAISRNLDLTTNEYCVKFVSKNVLSLGDPFWSGFLSFNLTPPINKNDQIILESKIEPLCQELLKNNLISGNLSTLIQIFCTRSNELLGATDTEPNIFNWQLFNALFIIRNSLKFLTETCTEEQLLEHIETNPSTTNHEIFELFIFSLFSIIVDVPIADFTYLIHLEAITCLLILLSVQFHTGTTLSENSLVYNVIMKGKHIISAPMFVKSLLINFINQQPLPANLTSHGHSLVIGLATGLWSILTFSNKRTENSSNNAVPDQNEFQNSPLATQSILLLLVLVNNWTTLNNPYKLSLFSCVNQDNQPLPPTNDTPIFKIDFHGLYGIFCKKATLDTPTLLLYLFLHRNNSFKSFLLNRLDLEELVVPILKTLYNAPNSNSYHIYMSIIILLILSEDDNFNKMIHDTKLKNITWYTERQLTEISLGGLLILVIIRTIQYNMLKMRDKYLHTNCLAALANMSSQFRYLHPYVSQRLVSLFETIAKKYQKLFKQLKTNNVVVVVDDNEKRKKTTEDNNYIIVELEQDLNVLEEVLRMVLEILNSTLTSQLIYNSNLIYTLLYNRQIFETFSDNVVFQDILHNIDIVIKYFSNLLNEKTQNQEVDTYQVLQVIQQGGKYWPKHKLTKFPELKFKYVEEEQPEEFFIPYVWDLVNQLSNLNWSTSSNNLTVC